MEEMTYIIPLEPVSWKRAGLKGKTFFDQQGREKVGVGLYIAQTHGEQPMFDGPLHVIVTFYAQKPGGTKRKQSTPLHFRRPDLDNYIKFLFDTCNGLIWPDDSLVCILEARKVYDNTPRTEMTVRKL